jgi:hypothetical protein
MRTFTTAEVDLARTQPVEAQPASPKKARATFHLSTELTDQVRDAVVFLAGPPEHLTMAAFVENAMRHELERLKKKHNKGKPFPDRPRQLRGGRPIGS